MQYKSLLLFIATLAQASAYTVRGFLDPFAPASSSSSPPIPLKYASSTEITLRSSTESYKTFLQAASLPVESSDLTAFAFVNVTEGSYQLSVNSINHVFPVLRVDVAENEVLVYLSHRGNDWSVTGPRQPYPIELKPLGMAVYYQVHSHL